MPNIALIPEAASRVPMLSTVVDGFSDVGHGIDSTSGGAPLEHGARVTDHIIANQPTLTMTGSVSGHPEAPGSTPIAAWAVIRRLHESVTPFEVITPFGRYSEMYISRLRNRQVGRGFFFTMELAGILRVGAAVATDDSAVSGPAQGRTGTVERGRVATALTT